jgi:hypothetical protein
LVLVKVCLLHPTDSCPTLNFIRAPIKPGRNAMAVHGCIVRDKGHKMAWWGTLVSVKKQVKFT